MKAVRLEDLDQVAHRALVEAGYAPLAEYVERFRPPVAAKDVA